MLPWQPICSRAGFFSFITFVQEGSPEDWP